jgi:hypothetical protein
MSRPSPVAPLAVAALLAATLAPAAPATAQPGRAADYLYVWATAVDTAAGAAPGDSAPRPRRRGVALLTVDLRDGSATRGRVVGALLADSAPAVAHAAHHTEHALADDRLLFANDFAAGRTHRFDLRTPGAPRLLGDFTTAGPFGFPHSFLRLPDGRVLATYQWQANRKPPGGLVELRRDGTALRWAGAATPGIDSAALQPYSLEVIPALDRVVTTSTSMNVDVGVHVQVWRLSDLTLLHTLPVPAAPEHEGHHLGTGAGAHAGEHHVFPGEPRLLADGRTVMLGTFTCGLYRLTGIDGAAPRLSFVQAFPGTFCAVPVRVGRWWVQTVPALHALVALDVTDPSRPREVARLGLGNEVTPHWLAADASGRRLVTTSGQARDPRVHLATLDPTTGALAPDPQTPTIDLSRVTVPGLGVVRAVPHGVVFGPGGW